MFDSHCHLTDDAFAEDLDAVLERAAAAGVNGIVTIASTAADAEAANRLAERHSNVWCTAGIHPHEASGAARDLPRLGSLLSLPRMVAVGETGLDYHYDNSPRDMQRRCFERHFELAAETGLPIVVHSRDANADTAAAVRSAHGVRGVLHCFTGDSALLDTALAEDWYIGFGGMITFRNWNGEDLLAQVPADRLLLETDGPYLAPVPHRGHRNEPAWVALICEAAARIRNETSADLGAVTERNARVFYRLAEAGPEGGTHPARP